MWYGMGIWVLDGGGKLPSTPLDKFLIAGNLQFLALNFRLNIQFISRRALCICINRLTWVMCT